MLLASRVEAARSETPLAASPGGRSGTYLAHGKDFFLRVYYDFHNVGFLMEIGIQLH